MIHFFRNATPSRRPERKECEHYYSYLDTLRADFNQKCGYCDDLDKLRIRSFTIDHFVPQNPIGFTHSIKPNFYYNLVYACRYCNGAKTNKWPTCDATLHHNGKIGFVDPIDEQYTKLFIRANSGKIVPLEDSELANYIHRELKLWLPIHERMWKLERVMQLNSQITEKLESLKDDNLKTELQLQHYQVLVEWYKIQETIFVEND